VKQILPTLFLFLFVFLFPKDISATISFTISNPIREGDYFIVDASLSGIASSSAFVQGMFTATSSANYFGFTWGQNEEWVNYVGSTNKDFIVQNFPILQKNISQKIWVKPNYADSAYRGPGEYFLKLKRYTGASDNSTGEDAVLTVNLSEPLPTPTPTPTEEPTNTPEPTTVWTPNPTKTPTPTTKSTPTPTKKAIPTATISAILGDSTSSALIIAFESASSGSSIYTKESTPSPEIKYKKPRNYKIPFFIGLAFTVLSGSLLYFRHRKD